MLVFDSVDWVDSVPKTGPTHTATNGINIKSVSTGKQNKKKPNHNIVQYPTVLTS